MRRSASSTTTMVPSTSMPTAMMSEKSTTMLIVSPAKPSTRMPVRNEPGMEIPTSPAVRRPSTATTTIITSTMAARTLLCRSRSMSRMSSDRSCRKCTCIPGGHSRRSCSTSARTSAMVSMMLAPMRLETSSANGGPPLHPREAGRVLECPPGEGDVPEREHAVAAGGHRDREHVLRRAEQCRHLHGERPCPVSIAPAATSWLLRATNRSRSSGPWSRLSRSPGSTITSSTSSRSPAISASSTPGSPSSLSRRLSRAAPRAPAPRGHLRTG